jgi:sugar phosphate isomerase/epimerase
MNRRNLLKAAGFSGMAAVLPSFGISPEKEEKTNFRFCLNTSTINGQSLGVKKSIETAARAGYDGVELWLSDIKSFTDSGGSLNSLKILLRDSGIRVESAIGFAPCFANDEEIRRLAFIQMQTEMEIMAELGCTRIAAPPAGLKKNEMPELYVLGQRYKQLIELGRKTGVMPQLEFWGASGTLFQFGQALMVAASANDPDVRILADVYHMFRGNSGFEGLKMVNGNLIEIFHMNDYPTTIEREKQDDSDRVFPGDGIAPLIQIVEDLRNMGGIKVLSLELFNAEYYKQDPLWVAETGLAKMKKLSKNEAFL